MDIHQAYALLSNINCSASDTACSDEVEEEVDRLGYDKAYAAHLDDPVTYTLDEVCRILEMD